MSSASAGARLRGVIALRPEACTSCMLCVRECPTWCITLDSHQAPDLNLPAGARTRLINVLDHFAIDFARCMSCSICVDVCPFDALAWSEQFDYDEAERTAMSHDIARLATDWPD